MASDRGIGLSLSIFIYDYQKVRLKHLYDQILAFIIFLNSSVYLSFIFLSKKYIVEYPYAELKIWLDIFSKRKFNVCEGLPQIKLDNIQRYI